MKKFLLLFLVTLVVGVLPGIGATVEKSYTIEFKTGSSADGTQLSTSVSNSNVFTTESMTYVSSFSSPSTAYYACTNGLRLGSKNNAGSIVLNLTAAAKVVPTKIVANIAFYGTDTSAGIGINTSTTTTVNSSSGDYYTVNYSNSSKLESISLYMKRGYIKSVTVYYEEETSGSGGGDVTDPNPGNGSYTITFDNNGTDASTDVTSNTLLEYITEGKEYVSSASDISKVYKGKTGIKFGTGSVVGTVTLNLKEKVTPTKIVVNAASYNSNNVTLSVNNVTKTLNSSDFNDYEFNFTNPAEISNISLATSGSEKRAYVKSITVYYGTESSDKTPVKLSYDKDSYTATKGENFTAPTLTVDPTEATGAVKYNSSNVNVATVDATGTVIVKELGKTIISAEIKDNEKYSDDTASYTLNVVKSGNYTVAEALTAIKNGYEGDAQVKGVITEIEEVSLQFGNATYDISDIDGANHIKVYRGNWLDGANFTDENQIEVGGTVIVEGTLKDYNGTLEIEKSKVIEYFAPVKKAEKYTALDKYEVEGIDMEVGDTAQLEVGNSHPEITYEIKDNEENVISINPETNIISANNIGIVEVIASWNGDDMWEAGSVEIIVNVSEPQLGEIVATVSDGQALVNDGTITITEGTTITFTAKNATNIVLVSADDTIEDAEIEGDTLVWTPTICKDEEVVVEATDAKGGSKEFSFMLTVVEKQYEKGSEENPYTVEEFLNNFNNLNSKVWVSGYIVGSMVNNNPIYGKATNHANTNLVLSDDANASSNSSYIPVELPSGNVRTALNIKDNEGNIGRGVMLYGSAETYFSKNGLKSVTSYKFLDETPSLPVPELYFEFEGDKVENVIEVNWDAEQFPELKTPNDAEFTVTYTSSDTNVAEIDNEGNITLKKIAGETIITATTEEIEDQYAAGSVSYTLVVLDPNSTKAMFDFTVKDPYGMTTTTGYQDGVTTAKEEKVTLTIDGRYRSWDTNAGYDLRLYKSGQESGMSYKAGSLTFSVPVGYKIETIEFTGNGSKNADVNALSANIGTFTNSVWETTKDEIVEEVVFTASNTSTIYGINVYYTTTPTFTFEGYASSNVLEISDDGRYISVYGLDENNDLSLNHELNVMTYSLKVGHEIEDVTIYYKVESTSAEKPTTQPTPDNIRARVASGDFKELDRGYADIPVDNDWSLNEEGDKAKYGAGILTLYYETADGMTSKPVTYNYVVSTDRDGSIATGVEVIGAEDEEAEYYTLQGVKVQNPERGIYIKVQNGKAVKVVK